MFSADFVCFNEKRALLKQCSLYPEDGPHNICGKINNEFKAYILTDTCKTEEIDQFDLVPAACLLYETAKENGCHHWDFSPAYNFCGKNYGEKYQPHVISNKCSLELAENEFGIYSEKNLERLQPKLDYLYSLISLMDRQFLEEDLSEYISLRPIISNDWDHELTQKLMILMKEVNKEITERSYLKLRTDSLIAIDLVLASHQYMNLLNRVYKLYAFVAHKEESFKKSFNDLNEYNLTVSSKLFHLLLENKTYNGKRVSNNSIEISLTNVDKQNAEYNALKSPHTKEEYAKLISFMGLRENLHNLWGISELKNPELLSRTLPRCEQTLSFQESGIISKFETIKENNTYEYFYEIYIKNIDILNNVLSQIHFVKDLDRKFLDSLYQKLPEYKAQVDSYIDEYNTKELILTEDFEALKEYSYDLWIDSLEKNIKSILIPQDMKKTINEQTQIIMNFVLDTYIEGVLETLQGRYPRVSSATQKEIENMTNTYFSAWKDLQFETLEDITQALFEIQGMQKSVDQKIDERVDTIYEELSKNTHLLESWQNSVKGDSSFLLDIRSSKELLSLLEMRALKNQSSIYKAIIDGDANTQIIQTLIMSIDAEIKKQYPNEMELLSSQNDQALAKIILQKVKELQKTLSENDLQKKNKLKNKSIYVFDKNGTEFHYTELYEVFQDSLLISLDKQKSIFRLNQLMGLEQDIIDKRIDILASKDKVEDLYFLSFDITAKELSYYGLKHKVESHSYTMAEFFDLLSIEFETFGITKEEQLILLNKRLEALANKDILLKFKIERQEKVKKVSYAHKYSSKPSLYESMEFKNRPIIEHMALKVHTGLDRNYLKEMILETLEDAESNITQTLYDFCIADYETNKDAFAKAFNAAKALRESIQKEKKGIYKGTEIEEFEEELSDEFRSTSEFLTEEILEPALMLTGGVALLFLILSPFGLSLGAAIAALGISPLMLTIGNISLLSIIAFTTSVHINENLIKFPAQIKYQEKLVSTQISTQKLASYESILDQISGNQINELITFGLLPLDIFYGVSVFKGVKKDLSIYALESLRNMSGLRGEIQEVSEVGKVIQRTSLKTNIKKRYKSYIQRRKQFLPKWAGDNLLRFSLSRAFLKSDLTIPQFTEKLSHLKKRWMSKLDFYEEIDELTGEQQIKWTLAREEGLDFLKVKSKMNPISYWLKTELKAIKSGNYQEFKRTYGGRTEKLRKLREKALLQEVEQLEHMLSKLKEVTFDQSDFEQILSALKEFKLDELSKLNEYLKFEGSEGFDYVFKEYTKIKQLNSHYQGDNPYIEDLKQERSTYIADPLDIEEDILLFNAFLEKMAR